MAPRIPPIEMATARCRFQAPRINPAWQGAHSTMTVPIAASSMPNGVRAQARPGPIDVPRVTRADPDQTVQSEGDGKTGADDGSDQAGRCGLRRGANRLQLDDRQAASGHRAVRNPRRRARCTAARHGRGSRRCGACRRALRRGGLPQRRWPCHRRSTDEGHPGRRRRRAGARGSGRHVGRVRPSHAGARPGHDRWTCVDDRCRRSDPRWRVGMDRARAGASAATTSSRSIS